MPHAVFSIDWSARTRSRTRALLLPTQQPYIYRFTHSRRLLRRSYPNSFLFIFIEYVLVLLLFFLFTFLFSVVFSTLVEICSCCLIASLSSNYYYYCYDFLGLSHFEPLFFRLFVSCVPSRLLWRINAIRFFDNMASKRPTVV